MKKLLKRTLALLMSLALVVSGVSALGTVTSRAGSTGYTELTFSHFGIEDGESFVAYESFSVQDSNITTWEGTAFTGKVTMTALDQWVELGGGATASSRNGVAAFGVHSSGPTVMFRDFQYGNKYEIGTGAKNVEYTIRITFDAVDGGTEINCYLNDIEGEPVATYTAQNKDTLVPRLGLAYATVTSVYVGQENTYTDMNVIWGDYPSNKPNTESGYWDLYVGTSEVLPGTAWSTVYSDIKVMSGETVIPAIVKKAGDKLLSIFIMDETTLPVTSPVGTTITIKAGQSLGSDLETEGINITEDFTMVLGADGILSEYEEPIENTYTDITIAGSNTFNIGQDSHGNPYWDIYLNVEGTLPGTNWQTQYNEVVLMVDDTEIEGLVKRANSETQLNLFIYGTEMSTTPEVGTRFTLRAGQSLGYNVSDGVSIESGINIATDFVVEWNGTEWATPTDWNYIYVSEGTMVVQRADVLCVEIEEFQTLFETNGEQYELTSSGEESGFYINGGKSSATTISYTQWGLYVDGTALKGGAWTTGDYVQIKGTFTQPVTSDVYELNFVFHCITASGTDATSSATWEMLSESDLPSVEPLSMNISYKNCENQEENTRWKLTVNTSPELNQTGSLGSASATLQASEGDVISVTIEKVMAGDISSELVFYLDYETIGKPSELVEGTKLTIQKCELSETLSIDNDMVLTWNGSVWTDLANADDIVGDANGDKELNIKDVVRYGKAFANEKTFAEGYISDLNKDVVTNEFDVKLMRRMLVGDTMDTISFECAMDVTSPTAGQVVYPYVDKVYDFLTTEGADIWDYYIAGTKPGRDGSLKDITITWNGVLSEDEAQYVNKYVVEYATKEDFTDAIAVATDESLTNVGVNNLYKATEYYVRVTAYAGNVVLGRSETVTFQTTDIGPRFMTVDGIYNVRDLGGYVTESGKRTLQGLIYRGSEMDGTHNINLTEAGDNTMSNLMGIKLDMDFRGLAECNYVTESPISSATKIHYPIGGYTDVFGNTYKEYLRQIFAAFADESNYPIYFHCWGGADRTGTIAYLLNGLCGVSETELVQDYELTSYAVFGVRADDWDAYNFEPFVTQLKTYEGDTLSEKIENYLLSIGVKTEEIYNIRAIMFGEETIDVPEDDTGIPNLSDYWTTESGYFTLDSTTKVASSDSAIGYGNKVRMDVTTVRSGANGDTYFFLGSYGVRLRGGSFRMSTLTSAGTYAEVAPRVEFSCSTNAFETEGGYLILGTEVVSDTEIKLTFEAVKADGTIACSDSYTFARISDEITTTDAKVTIAMSTSEMTSVTVKTGK